MTLLYIILATFAVSLISFVGVIALLFSKHFLEKILLILVALAAGGLMGGAFLHLIPEALHELEKTRGHEATTSVFLFVILGFVLFLIIEQVFHWHHHHYACKTHVDCPKVKKKPMSYMILIGDGAHNFIDGLIIAASFVVSPMTGIISAVAVALHEIPQEMGDFGVLVYGGFNKRKAIFYNFLSGLVAVIGGIVGYLFVDSFEIAVPYMLPFAAGGFIYLAASDLVPEIKHGDKGWRMALNLVVFLIGVGLMLGMKLLFGHE